MMNKLKFICLFFVLILSIGFQQIVIAQDTPKVLLFITDGSPDLEFMLTNEVGVMKKMLEQSGIEVDVATLSGEPISVGSVNLSSVLKLTDVIADDYAGIILPCMAARSKERDIPEMVAIVKKALGEGKPVAAQFDAICFLARAGVLNGKKYSYGTEVDLEELPEFEGGIYSGTGIVQDGNIITSGVCPFWARQSGLKDGTPGLTQALIEAVLAKNKQSSL